MKTVILSALVTLIASHSFATTVTCRVGDPETEGVQKVMTSEELKAGRTLFENSRSKYSLNITAKDAMVLTAQVDGSAPQSMVSEESSLIYIDYNQSFAVVCLKTN